MFAGAGAGGIASAKLLLDFGATNIILVDSVGIIHRGRTDLTPVKTSMLDVTNPENRTGGIAEAMRGADVFIGLAVADMVTPEMVSSMARDSVVFAMANPVPEIMPDLAEAAGAAVVGTGRSDFRNQINNQPGLPRRVPRRPRRQGLAHHDQHEARSRTGAGRPGPRAHPGAGHPVVTGPRRPCRRGRGPAPRPGPLKTGSTRLHAFAGRSRDA